MISYDAIKKFEPYLNEIKPWQGMADCGLVSNAPPEAIEQYEKYKKMIKEADESEIEFL